MISFKSEEKKIIKQTIDIYGRVSQSIVAMEELAELIQAISKVMRTDNEDSLIEEMADVYIMLEQLQEMYAIGDELINEKITKKLQRQAEINKKAEAENGE